MTPDAAAPPPDRERVLRALSWSTAGTGIATALVLARSVLLPRLLLPEEFGRFGLVWFALSAVTTLTDPGLGRAALALRLDDQHAERRFLDTLWTFHLVRGLAIAGLVTLLAVPYSEAVHQPRLWPLLAATSATAALQALASPGTLLLYRNLEQRTLSLQRIASELFSLLVTVLAAWLSPTAWALVLGSLAGALFGALVSYLGQPYRPRLAWSSVELRRALGQGRYLGLVGALTFVTTQVDNLIVGRALGAAALGTYLFAYRIGSLPIESLYQVLSAVALPWYVRLRQQSAAAVAERLGRTLSASTFLLCAALLPALLLRRELVWLLGGPRWAAAAALVPPIFLLAVLRFANMNLGLLLLALERSDLDSRVKLIEALLFVPGCAFAVNRFGSAGAAWAGAASYALALAIRSQAAISLLPGEGPGVRKAWARPALTGLACAAAALWAQQEGAPPLLLAVLALAGFVALTLRADPALWRELRSLRRLDA